MVTRPDIASRARRVVKLDLLPTRSQHHRAFRAFHQTFGTWGQQKTTKGPDGCRCRASPRIVAKGRYRPRARHLSSFGLPSRLLVETWRFDCRACGDGASCRSPLVCGSGSAAPRCGDRRPIASIRRAFALRRRRVYCSWAAPPSSASTRNLPLARPENVQACNVRGCSA